MSSAKKYAEYISEQQRRLRVAGLVNEDVSESVISEGAADSDPIAYHKKMISHHGKMAGFHASAREDANDEDDSDLAHDHANDENHHLHAEYKHREALEAHENNKPDAMKKTKEAWNKSESNAPYTESDTPKAHVVFGKKHKLD